MNRKRGRPVGTYKHVVPSVVGGKRTWAWTKYMAMLQRCNNPNSHNYKYYGARGISVCARWLGKDGFDNFVMDLGERSG